MRPSGPHGRARRATAVGLAGNGLLFVVKGGVGLVSGSIALVSDALNSLVDVVASIAIWWSVEVAHRDPDADHPFGHERAETIAALGVAIFTAILGFEIARTAIERLIEGPQPITLPGWAIGALLFSIAGNLVLARYLRARGEALESPAILANAVESENDVWTSLAALVGVTGAVVGWPAVDPVAGIVVGGWIVVGGYRFGRDNIDYLMGKSPGGELLERIATRALEVAGVRGVHDLRAHYVGHRVHVEVHVEVDQEMRTRQSHDIGGEVRAAIEGLPEIDHAFVHVDPVLDSTYVIETLARRERIASRIYERLARAHADREPLSELWQILATNALIRAERLSVARRLRSAGWHFADAEIAPETARRRFQSMLDAAAALKSDGDVDPAEAIALLGEIESDVAMGDYHRAVTPRDPTLLSSLEAATPPPPSRNLLLHRARAAVVSLPEGAARAHLEALSSTWAGGERS